MKPSWEEFSNIWIIGRVPGGLLNETLLMLFCMLIWMDAELLIVLYVYDMCMFYVHVFNVHIHHIASMFPFNLRITPRRSGRSCDNKRFQMGCIAADRFGLGFLPKWWRPLEFSYCFATWMKRGLKQRIVFRMIHVNDFVRPRGKVWST